MPCEPKLHTVHSAPIKRVDHGLVRSFKYAGIMGSKPSAAWEAILWVCALKRSITLWSYESTSSALNFISIFFFKVVLLSIYVILGSFFFGRVIKDDCITYSFSMTAFDFSTVVLFLWGSIQTRLKFQVIYFWSDCKLRKGLYIKIPQHMAHYEYKCIQSIKHLKENHFTYEGKSICCLTMGVLCISKPGVLWRGLTVLSGPLNRHVLWGHLTWQPLLWVHSLRANVNGAGLGSMPPWPHSGQQQMICTE